MQSKIAANAAAVRRWLAKAEETLGNHSDRLNAINIFPVADGDTGTNLYLTVRAASAAIHDLELADVGAVLAVAGRAAMESARGNSGTLFSVFLAALAEPLIGSTRLSAPLLAAGLQRAQIRAWSALSEPLPGTMLSVLEASADAASAAEAAQHGDDSNHALALALDAAVQAALNAVVQTESQLVPLREAKVVDAGGVGLLLVLDCLRSAVLGQELDAELVDGLSGYDVQDPHIHANMPEIRGVEIMCTISLSPLAAAGLRMQLDELGDSVIMSALSAVGELDGGYRWRLHVHVPESGPALELIHAAGDPINVSVIQLSAIDRDAEEAARSATEGTEFPARPASSVLLPESVLSPDTHELG
ncbi:DAK2 domain-containing protein [Arthrobacter sp. H14-L1]|uniref:DAK2 domain-containing protein n=1 Tax=Arthrobacter sp. H14-L1 TaxID=2996697 RepID=UPI0022708F79|nr:DAK2 domain-containing protein [Arthrobacter sp. H14-L1]MCY0905479.1 DAK2 domain-containing protein [Arthrobacter sp. H14-L1]